MAKNKLFFIALAAYLFLLFFLPKHGHDWDNYCWGLWAELIQKKGLTAVYLEGSPVNYLPLYLYVLKIYSLLIPQANLFEMTYILKGFSLIFDVVAMTLLTSYFLKNNWKYFLLGLFNFGFLYNAFIWNQVDGILACLVFASILAGMKQQPELSLCLFLLALNFKLQAIVLLPVVLANISHQLNHKNLITSALYLLGIELLILSPFILAGNVQNIWHTATSSLDFYPSISMNAFNFWHLFYSESLMFVNDNLPFLGPFSHKQIGLTLFFLFSAIICWPLLRQSLRNIRQINPKPIGQELILLSASLLIFVFFYFNTQMHERYIHMAILFSTALAFAYKAYAQWILLSTAYALSLESICKFLKLNNYNTLIFHPTFISIVYLSALVLLSIQWMKAIRRVT